jgi:hypothetical protein
VSFGDLTKAGNWFLWARYEVFEAGFAMGGEGGCDCCDEILAYLDSIDGRLASIAGNVAQFWSSWIEDFLPGWQAQDLFLRQVLNEFLEYETPTYAPTSPVLGDSPPAISVLGAAAYNGLQEALPAPLNFGFEGVDRETAPPPLSISLPTNPMGLPGILTDEWTFTIDISRVPHREQILFFLRAMFILCTLWWSAMAVWEETRKYG